MARFRKLKRTITAPAPIGPGAVNHIQSVVVDLDHDVIWEWTHAPDGARFVSGFRVVPRLPTPARTPHAPTT